MRTARSPIVRDVLDYSCTLCDAEGRILAQAKTVALHLGAVPDAIEAMLAQFGDDTGAGRRGRSSTIPIPAACTCPTSSCSSRSSCADRLQGYAVVIAHHCDVGGRVPGSNAADSTEIYQEGLRIPPLKLYRRAARPTRRCCSLIRQQCAPAGPGARRSRGPACDLQHRRARVLPPRSSAMARPRQRDYFDRLIDYGETLTRKAIAAWPDGTLSLHRLYRRRRHRRPAHPDRLPRSRSTATI